MTLRTDLRRALAAAASSTRDQATVALAVRYAGLIDNASPARKYAKALTWLASLHVEDDDAVHIATINAALAEHSVVSDLGPKLLSTLEALEMSPRARAAAHRGEVKNVPAPANPLDQLAAARARRGHPETVDPAVP